MMFEKDAKEYYYKKVFAETNPKNETELKEKFLQTFKDSAEFGYNKGYHDAEEHYMQVIDNQHKLVDESKNEAKRLLARWVDDRPYTVSEQKDLIADTEQFLSEE